MSSARVAFPATLALTLLRMAIALADLALHKPIRLARRGSGSSDSIIWTGTASGADLLEGYAVRMADGSIGSTAEVTRQARIDTARGLKGVKVVSPEDHQRWVRAHAAGDAYEETALGTVLDSDLDPDTDRVVFEMSVHDAEYNRRIALPDHHPNALPMVSVAYEPILGDASDERADFAQLGRRVRHLALVPKGRDPHAHIVRGFADGAPMPTIKDLKKSHPKQVLRAAIALAHAFADAKDPAEFRKQALADAPDYNTMIPAISKFLQDKTGKLIVHGLLNEPAELEEIETGIEDEDPAAVAAKEEEAMADKKQMTAMADALKQANAQIAKLTTDLGALSGKVAPLVERQSAADADAVHTALVRKAERLAAALDHNGVTRPDGFDPMKPTAAMIDAANDALADAMVKPRPTLSAPRTTGRRWNGDGTSFGEDAGTDDLTSALHV